MRKLLIGASSPIAYSYITERELGRPSPVLESPVSYCLLYDELWFLSRTLCPPELENLNFVHFVDQEFSPKLPFDKVPEEERRPLDSWNWDEWQQTIDLATGDGRRWRCDNHARGIEFGGVSILPSPGLRANLFIDRFIATEFGFELAENTPNSRASAYIDSQILQITLSERVIAPRIVAPRAPFGFWHPCLSELRNDGFLKDFRTKIASMDITDFASIDAKVSELVGEYERQLLKSVKDRFSPMDIVYSTSSFLLGTIPGVGVASGAADWLRVMITKINDRKSNGWAAFLASVDGAKPST